MAEWKPRVLLLDLTLVQANAGGLVARLLRRSPRTRIILLTHHAAETQILNALLEGALGYLPKPTLPPDLQKAGPPENAGGAWRPGPRGPNFRTRLGGRATQPKSRYYPN